jgi:S-adenosylmethionine/arginine decarboxylase-like enzyme
VAVHTWPELGRVTLDVFVCNLHSDNSARAQRVLAALESSFGAAGVEHHRLERGQS